jgi:ATP-dependent Clp protease adaptor protein ClpS
MPQEQSNVKERQHIDISEPKRYKVIIHNDDFTTMEFVVLVLKQIFFYSDDKAETLMLQVHNEGKSTVGIYTYDIAHPKVRKATTLAREKNFPLRLTVEEEE